METSKCFKTTIVVLFALVFICGCSDSGNNQNDSPLSPPSSDSEVFSSIKGDITATTVKNDDIKITTITDSNGTKLLVMETTTNDITISYAGTDGTTNISFSTPLTKLPSDFATNRLAAYVAASIELDNGVPADMLSKTLTALPLDSPGCDLFPDTQCTLGCCALHDQCYSANNCNWTSWLPYIGSEACDNCNDIVSSCINRACGGVEEPGDGDRCYDQRCDEFYDCGGANCDCVSPCDQSPPSCGNGSCEVGEDKNNCYADCNEGAGINQCCWETNNCPSETPSDCPGDCCCCDYGEVCGADYLCGPP